MTTHNFQTFADASISQCPDNLRRKLWVHRQRMRLNMTEKNSRRQGVSAPPSCVGQEILLESHAVGTPLSGKAKSSKPAVPPEEGRAVKRCAGFVLQDGKHLRAPPRPPDRLGQTEKLHQHLLEEKLRGTGIAPPPGMASERKNSPSSGGAANASQVQRSGSGECNRKLALGELEAALGGIGDGLVCEARYARAQQNLLAHLSPRRKHNSLCASVMSAGEREEEEDNEEREDRSPRVLGIGGCLRASSSRRLGIATAEQAVGGESPAGTARGPPGSQGGAQGVTQDAAVQSSPAPAPAPQRICRVKVVRDTEIPFEEQQWRRLPSPPKVKEDAATLYHKRLEHNFPCPMPALLVPQTVQSARGGRSGRR